MKRLLLAGAAFAALSSASYAADMPPVYEPVATAWDGFFLGIQGGWAFSDLDVDADDGINPILETSSEPDDFVIGAYYGRNWQFDNWVLGLDSSISYIGIDEVAAGNAADFDVEANILGLSRLKAGFAADNFLFFVAGGLATTWFEVDDGVDDDDSFAFGWTVGAGVETKFTDNWSARVEYIYANIEDDDMSLSGDDVDVELETHIVRGGIAYHF